MDSQTVNDQTVVDSIVRAEPGGSANLFNFGGIFIFAVCIVAVLMMGAAVGLAMWSLAYAQTTHDEIADLKMQIRDSRNDISVWETDVFNRQKDIEANLRAHGYDFKGLKPLKPPPQ